MKKKIAALRFGISKNAFWLLKIRFKIWWIGFIFLTLH